MLFFAYCNYHCQSRKMRRDGRTTTADDAKRLIAAEKLKMERGFSIVHIDEAHFMRIPPPNNGIAKLQDNKAVLDTPVEEPARTAPPKPAAATDTIVPAFACQFNMGSLPPLQPTDVLDTDAKRLRAYAQIAKERTGLDMVILTTANFVNLDEFYRKMVKRHAPPPSNLPLICAPDITPDGTID